MDFSQLFFVGMSATAALTSYTLLRFCTGLFFAISGYHKLFNKTRHASLVSTLSADGIPFLWFNQWFVPAVELTGGLGVAFGVVTPLAALGLICICVVATCTDGFKRITSWLDKADKLDDYLYLPEVIYTLILLAFITGGAGPISFDHFLATMF